MKSDANFSYVAFRSAMWTGYDTLGVRPFTGGEFIWNSTNWIRLFKICSL